jgi:hypothetical protein
MLNILGILKKTFDCFDRIAVSNRVLVFWAVVEGKLFGFPFSSPIWHCVYFVMKATDVVIGEAKFINNLKRDKQNLADVDKARTRDTYSRNV